MSLLKRVSISPFTPYDLLLESSSNFKDSSSSSLNRPNLTKILSMDLCVSSKYVCSSSLGDPESASFSWIYMMVLGNIDACTATIYISCSILSIPIHSNLLSFLDYIYWRVIISSYFPDSPYSSFSKCSPTCLRCQQQYRNKG